MKCLLGLVAFSLGQLDDELVEKPLTDDREDPIEPYPIIVGSGSEVSCMRYLFLYSSITVTLARSYASRALMAVTNGPKRLAKISTAYPSCRMTMLRILRRMMMRCMQLILMMENGCGSLKCMIP